MPAAPRKTQFGGRVAERRRRMRQWLIGVGIALALIFVGAIAYVARLPALTVSSITVSGTQAVSASDVVTTAQAAMQGTWLFLVPKHNAFFYPAPTMRKNILAAYPRIALADIEARGLTGLAIAVTERQPHALWCLPAATSAAQAGQNSDCYLVDENGFIFDSASGFSGNAYLSYETHIASSSPIGQQALPADEFKKTDAFLTTLKNQLNLEPQKLVAVSDTEADVYLESGARIMYDRTQDLSVVFNNIKTAFSSGELSPDKLPTLEYADFRFGNKVYYKFK